MCIFLSYLLLHILPIPFLSLPITYTYYMSNIYIPTGLTFNIESYEPCIQQWILYSRMRYNWQYAWLSRWSGNILSAIRVNVINNATSPIRHIPIKISIHSLNISKITKLVHYKIWILSTIRNIRSYRRVMSRNWLSPIRMCKYRFDQFKRKRT